MNSPFLPSSTASSAPAPFVAHLDRAAGDFALLDVDQVWRQGQRQIQVQRFSVGLGMLSLVVVLAVAVVNLAPNTRSGMIDAATAMDDASPAADGQPAAAAAVPAASDVTGPVQGDHWHAAFGISVCGEFQPPLMSTIDVDGIHSHQDNLIHIHPFFESSSGENARMQLFFDNMGLTVTDASVTLPGANAPLASDGCTIESVRMAEWQFDFDQGAPEIRTSDFGAARFVNDRQVFVLYLGPADGEITKPPSMVTLSQVAPMLLDELVEEDASMNGAPLVLPADTPCVPSDLLTAELGLDALPPGAPVCELMVGGSVGG